MVIKIDPDVRPREHSGSRSPGGVLPSAKAGLDLGAVIGVTSVVVGWTLCRAPAPIASRTWC